MSLRLSLPFVLFASFVVSSLPNTRAAEPLGLRVPHGFEVTLFADDDLAHDIFSLTIDSLGRVVVSGPGYVRILVDRDGDGRADSYIQYADGPKTGAQGMCFDGRDLVCTGDAGLIRYRDANADDRADGPPETLLKLRAGGEHHAHAVQRGPDGWWYVVCGNMTGITEKDVTLPTSPVLRPRAGTLLRLKPDFSGCEVVAHGFRNCYDFAFNAQGDIFTYDSDGEREVSLPWYRPTRVFHVLPGSDAGWVSETWKHPDYFPDMPPVVASLGRGSPTGVVCYRHDQFPPEYRGALLVADWTFGRIVALPLTRDGETWKTTPKDFITGAGSFGFAPTDMEVAPDGSLYVSVGGRGTRGGVYRVRYKGAAKVGDSKPATSADELNACLSAPQPLASWSRARWAPLVTKLGRQALQDAALDEYRDLGERIRAIETLTDLFGGIGDSVVDRLANSQSREIRARLAWAIRGQLPAASVVRTLQVLARDQEPLVALAALAAAVHGPTTMDLQPLHKELVKGLGSDRRLVRWESSRIVGRNANLDVNHLQEIIPSPEPLEPITETPLVWMTLGYGTRPIFSADFALSATLRVAVMTRRTVPADLRLAAIRSTQLLLGDLTPTPSAGPFDGYTCRRPIGEINGFGREQRRALASVFPRDDRTIDLELSRLLAMLAHDDARLLDRVLDKIDDASSATDDVHYLFVAARNSCKRSRDQTLWIARALVNLDEKVAQLKLNIDTNWEPSILAMYEELVKRDPDLPAAVVRHIKFGRAEHVVFAKNLPEKLLPTAMTAFERRMRADKGFPVTTDLVLLLGKSTDAEHLELVRRLHDERLSVRGPALIVLAKRAEAVDQARFVAGLDEAAPEVLASCLEALSTLPTSKEAKEQIALLRAVRRLSGDEREYALREKAAALLQRAWGDDLAAGFVFGKPGHRPQPVVINKWTDFLRGKFADEFAKQTGGTSGDAAAVKTILAGVDWSHGDVARGAKVFEMRSCSRCHSGRTALGPDLAGVARRFSREDLFTAIYEPSRDVSPRYQATMIQTTDGKTYSGLVIYESVDGVTLRDGLNQTLRIDGPRIEARRKQAASFMPTGLLKDAQPDDLADLYAYLQSLGQTSPK